MFVKVFIFHCTIFNLHTNTKKLVMDFGINEEVDKLQGLVMTSQVGVKDKI